MSRSRDAEGSLAALTILPKQSRATTIPGITVSPIPHATADPGTLTIHITTTSTSIQSESESIAEFKNWSGIGGLSVYTDVRTTGTPRRAGLGVSPGVQRMPLSNRSVFWPVQWGIR
jgi:hypothetical protein